VDEKSWTYVGDYIGGGLWLSVQEKHVAVIYRWQEKIRWKYRTLITCWGEESFSLAKRVAQTECRWWTREICKAKKNGWTKRIAYLEGK